MAGGHPKSGETPMEGIITEIKEVLVLIFQMKSLLNSILDAMVMSVIKCIL